VKEELKKSFGKKILSSSGKPDNKRIADLIFNDEKSLKLINALIHPLVQEYFHEWRKKQSSPYVLKEAAILFESGSYKDCDKIILVTAPAEVRIQRILQRDKRTRKEVIEIMSHQWTDEKKIKHSDFVIVNDETELVIPQVLIINNELLKLSIKA
jgi:dephospho-CoA kinase